MAKNNILEDHSDLMEVVIYDIPEKGIQYRLAISLFRDVHYLSIREWYASYDNEFAPTNNGFTIVYNLSAVSGLYKAISTILSKAETLEAVHADKSFLEMTMSALNFVSNISKEMAISPADLVDAKIINKTDYTITLDFRKNTK